MQSHLQNRCIFRRLRNAAKESASLIVCSRAFQSLEQSWKRLRNQTVWVCFHQHLESTRVVAMMSEVSVQEHTGEEFLQVFQHCTHKDMIL